MATITYPELDEIICEEFPRPVALLYKQAIDAQSPEEIIDFALKTFEFCIRTISLTLVIRYLNTPVKEINSRELNQYVEDHIHDAKVSEWIALLRLSLLAYHGHRDRFFVPEIYDLYWQETDEPQDENTLFWSLITDFDRPRNQYLMTLDGANRVLNQLREILRYFISFKDYELWLITRFGDEGIEYELHQGQGAAPKFVSFDQLNDNNIRFGDNQRPGYYYLYNTKRELLPLDPLILTPVRLNVDDELEQDIGLYYEFFLGDESNPRALLYMLMASERNKKTTDDDLVQKFFYLYSLINHKKEANTKYVAATWENFQKITLLISKHHMEHSAKQKYEKTVYVDRRDIDTVLEAFLDDTETLALMLAGEAGVGKTNLLANLYSNISSRADGIDWAVLWLEGADLKTTESLEKQLLVHLETHIQIPGEDLSETVRLKRYLRNELNQGRKLLLIIDALNENNYPSDAFQTVNNFVNEFASADMRERIRLIVSSRPQVWNYVKRYLNPYRASYYYGAGQRHAEQFNDLRIVQENDSFVMQQYSAKEQEIAFTKYSRHFNLENQFLDNLQERLVDALLDPLIMSLTCQAWEGDAIPEDFMPEEIIPRLIEKMVASADYDLIQSDIDDFLEGLFVPKLFEHGEKPVNQLKRDMLQDDDMLRGLITDSALNAPYRHLERAGWLVRSGEPIQFVIRFRYEYFYDYFAGQYLYQQYKNTDDKIAVFTLLDKALFLWGPLRNLLVKILIEDRNIEFLDKLAHKSDAYQKQLLISVIAQYFPEKEYQNQLLPLLLQWLDYDASDSKESNIPAEIASNIAVISLSEALLKKAFMHPNEKVRLAVIQNVHIIWREDAQLVSKFMIPAANTVTYPRIIGGFIKTIRTPPKDKYIPAIENVTSLFQATLLILMNTYIDKRNYNMTFVELKQVIWYPIIERLLIVRKRRWQEQIARFLRQILLRGIIRFVLIRNLEKDIESIETSSTQIIFGYEELKAMFDNSRELMDVYQELLPHFDGAQKDAPFEIDKLVETTKRLALNRESDLMIDYLILGSFDAYFLRDPYTTAKKIGDLFTFLAEQDMYPPTESLEEPTGNAIFPIIQYPLGFSVIAIDHPNYRDIIKIQHEMGYVKEEQFRNIWRLGCGTTLRHNNLSDLITSYLVNDLDLGREYLQKHINLLVSRKDHVQIRRTFSGVADGIAFGAVKERTVLDTGMLLLHDILSALQPYLKELNDNKQSELYNLFWKEAVEYLKKFLGKHHDSLVQLVKMCDNNVMPENIKESILTDESLQEDFNYSLTVSGLWFLFDMLKDDEPIARDNIKWGIQQVPESRNLRDFLRRVLRRVLFLVYDEKELI